MPNIVQVTGEHENIAVPEYAIVVADQVYLEKCHGSIEAFVSCVEGRADPLLCGDRFQIGDVQCCGEVQEDVETRNTAGWVHMVFRE